MISSCLLLAGCNSEFMHIFSNIINQPCEYHEYPNLYDEETGEYIYDGNVYYEKNLHGIGLCLAGDKIIVGRGPTMYGGCIPMYKSEYDTEANVLQNAYGYYIKEGITIPKDILSCQIESITLKTSENSIKIVWESFFSSLTIKDILKMDEELEYAQLNERAIMKVEIVGYPYLTSNGIGLYDYDGILCLGFNVDRHKYCRIKDEYQETFRNAINELKKTCNELNNT